MQRKQRLYATALEASLANLEIVRVRHRPWRPWRSPQESWQIRHLVWQWFTYRGPKWSERMLARRLGVHHHCVQKLLREFASDRAKMLREKRACGFTMATFEQLCEARDQTKRMAERGLLRPLRRSMWGDRKIIWSPLRIRQRFRCGRHLDIR